jgi:hypothetical protein
VTAVCTGVRTAVLSDNSIAVTATTTTTIKIKIII